MGVIEEYPIGVTLPAEAVHVACSMAQWRLQIKFKWYHATFIIIYLHFIMGKTIRKLWNCNLVRQD